MKIAGILWLIIWLVSGTYLFAWLTLNRLPIMNAFLPVLVIGWSILFFVGHALIGRICKKLF